MFETILLRNFTIGNTWAFEPFICDLALLILIGSFGYFVRPRKQFTYFFVWMMVYTVMAVVNSVYYVFYTSFASFSLLATLGLVGDVGDSLTEKLRVIDFIYLLGPIAVAAYSYMALIPLIQPPIMKLLTTKKEREIKMNQLRTVSKAEKIIFPIVVTVICVLILPSVAPLLGFLMLGNLFKESGLTDRLSDTAQNSLCNIVTILLGTTVGATAEGSAFLNKKTLLVIGIGLLAFAFSTAGGVLFAKLMNIATGGKVNPLIGSAGVSAVPMAARVAQTEGRKYNPSNFLLMHAMGPNVAGVIGSAVAAGFLLSQFG